MSAADDRTERAAREAETCPDCDAAGYWSCGHQHLMHQFDAARAEAAALRGLALGRVRHTYAGLCPDDLEGWDSRDPACPACAVLAEHGGHP